MSYPVSNTKDAKVATVDATEEDFALDLPPGVGDTLYEMCSSTACWYKQGRARKLTFTTKANATDGDYFTIEIDGASVVYEFDKTGNGVTSGRTAIDISGVGVVTAANVAAATVTAIAAAQPTLVLTDNADGTVEVVANGSRMTITENVAHASFTIGTSTALAASAAAGSKFVPAGKLEWISPKYGQNISIVRDAADGKASLVLARFVR